MNEKQTWFQSIWYWRLAFFECFTDMFIVGATAFIGSVANSDWSQINATAKMTIILCMCIAMLKVLKTNLSTTIQTLKDNQPIPEGTTVQQQTTTTQITNTAIPAVTPVTIQPPQLGPK